MIIIQLIIGFSSTEENDSKKKRMAYPVISLRRKDIKVRLHLKVWVSCEPIKTYGPKVFYQLKTPSNPILRGRYPRHKDALFNGIVNGRFFLCINNRI